MAGIDGLIHRTCPRIGKERPSRFKKFEEERNVFAFLIIGLMMGVKLKLGNGY